MIVGWCILISRAAVRLPPDDARGANVDRLLDTLLFRGDQQIDGALHVDLFERALVVAGLIILAKVGGGVKQDVAAGQTGCKCRDVAHIAGYEIDLFIGKNTQGLFLRADQSSHFVSLIEQCAHEITTEQAGCPRDKSVPAFSNTSKTQTFRLFSSLTLHVLVFYCKHSTWPRCGPHPKLWQNETYCSIPPSTAWRSRKMRFCRMLKKSGSGRKSCTRSGWRSGRPW